MVPHVTKKRKLTSLSGGHHHASNAQERAGDSSQDSSEQDTDIVPGNGAIRGRPTTVEAKRYPSASWSSGTYDSNMFKLKVHELLARVRPDYERCMLKVENSLRMLKDIIERIPDREAKPVCAFVSVLI